MADFEEQKEVARMVQQESPSKAEAEDSNSSGSESIPLQLKLPNKKTIYDPGEPRRVNTRAETSCHPRKKTSSEIQSCEKGLMMLLKCLGRYALRYGMVS